MKTCDFNFDLPQHLVAQYPPEKRGQSRLMVLNRVTGKRDHRIVTELPGILCAKNFLSPEEEAPLLVFNDTRVRKARVRAKSETGAEEEFLFLEGRKDGLFWKTLVKRARRKKAGSIFTFFDSDGARTAKAAVCGFEGDYVLLEFEESLDESWFEKYGAVPLPPYIKRKDNQQDSERYQTVYARQTGSAASPTAGLHFTNELLDALKARGAGSAFVTLHAGLGTFLPVRAENVEDHVMHEESFLITEENAAVIEEAMAKKRKIIAVGTTSLRVLESAFCEKKLKRGWQSTSIFIYPGYEFKAVDALFTNFHTPLSTLLMLVCAFAGRELILESYAEAVREEYRFFSYGDAMLII
jgi:S-adenosylmethionine:tRNA ribosyltransferase-isomerase